MKMYGGERVEQLMDWLKIEEDMPIESGMLTKSIENAQKKVEGRNFDARKHVLQYDDVMNKQRKVIYDERKRILMGGDLREQTLRFLKSAVDRIVDTHTVRDGRDYEIDYPALALDAQQSFPLGTLELEVLLNKSPEEIAKWLSDRVLELYELKEFELGLAVLSQIHLIDEQVTQQGGGKVAIPEAVLWLAHAQQRAPESWGPWFAEANQLYLQYKDSASSGRSLATEIPAETRAGIQAFGAPLLREYERQFTLRSIDENWIEHLNLLDHLRSGVSLRGYGQQDPVVVYAQEAFAEFENFKQQIELDVVRKIFLVRMQEAQRPTDQRSAYNVRGMIRPGDGPRINEQGRQLSEVRSTAKIGRNTKCYCGSGKKYKQCHLAQDHGNPPENWVELYRAAYSEDPNLTPHAK
jgi:preprotein translocase subunit SecA